MESMHATDEVIMTGAFRVVRMHSRGGIMWLQPLKNSSKPGG